VDDVVRLSFDCVGARAEPYTAAPTLTFALRIAETIGVSVHAMALRCQIRIEPRQRRYSAQETRRLVDLFGDPSRWADTLTPIQFTTVTTMVPGFTGAIDIDMPVPCSYDLEIAATRYFHGLREDVVPLVFLFSGTVFVKTATGYAVSPVPWSAECTYRLPVSVWQDMMQMHFPGSGWIRLSHAAIDALAAYKSREALPTWDAAIASLLAAAGATELPAGASNGVEVVPG
jgi:uncharacterized protein DUF6084